MNKTKLNAIYGLIDNLNNLKDLTLKSDNIPICIAFVPVEDELKSKHKPDLAEVNDSSSYFDKRFEDFYNRLDLSRSMSIMEVMKLTKKQDVNIDDHYVLHLDYQCLVKISKYSDVDNKADIVKNKEGILYAFEEIQEAVDFMVKNYTIEDVAPINNRYYNSRMVR